MIRALLAGMTVMLAVAPLPAQVAAPSPAVAIRNRPAPLQYFGRSALLPGWGQASLDRKLTGAIFIAFEGIALGMVLKTHHEMSYLERTDSVRLESKREERQDWLVLLAFNHLFSGLEAFVSANLYDFPADLGMRVLDGGRTGFGVTLPIGRR